MFRRHFLCLSDFSANEINRMLDLAKKLKAAQQSGVPHQLLFGKTLAMIFQKPSNRTRVSFEVGMFQLGGTSLTIRPSDIDMGKREPISDIAKVMSRYVDAVVLRVVRHSDIQEFANYSSKPVINGLSDLYHPCQAVADLLTIEEKKGDLRGKKLCYVGDGNNVCNSLVYGAQALGMEAVVACPEGYDPLLSPADGHYEIIRNPEEAVADADVVYTDVWTSMGQEAERQARLKAFETYTITERMIERAKKDMIFMHCLPAHRGEEVDKAVVDGPHSVVFDQAENRMHAQKAILALLLVENPQI